MSCGTCSTKVGGCKSNGLCKTGGCNRLNTFDWLCDMEVPDALRYTKVEVRFKSGRKGIFENKKNFYLATGDAVVVDTGSGGYDLGFVSLQGELVRLQIKKKNIRNEDTKDVILREAHSHDIEKYEKVKARELPTLFRTRELIVEHKLKMKLTDVEFQIDNAKATFFYSADDRVDFRELIKVVAAEFKVRVEMRQINLRQEAGRLGGIGVCGRELCCSTWLTSFKNVNTSAARYQNLSINPAKLSGQCGRLKCCLNYELDSYMDALKDIPAINGRLKTNKGELSLEKTDIFKKMLWFSVKGKHEDWIAIPAMEVSKILKINQSGTEYELQDTRFEGFEESKNGFSVDQFQDSEMDKLNSKRQKKTNQNKKRHKKGIPKRENPSDSSNDTK